MKFPIIAVLLLVKFCESSELLCAKFDNARFFEVYCSKYTGVIPVNCDSSILTANITSQVNELKVGGCDHDQVQLYLDLFPNLHSLDVSYSGIESLDQLNLKHDQITRVNAAHNQLAGVPLTFFALLPHVVEIDFSHNQFNEVNEFPSKTVTINLSHNNLSSIHSEDFANLTELENLDLSYNLITKLDPNIFTTNGKLKTLQLEKNEITTFGEKFSSLLERGVSVYISWKNITYLRLLDYKMRVRHSGGEGVLRTADGSIELHCNENRFESMSYRFKLDTDELENPTEMLHCLTPSLEYLNFKGKLDLNVLHKFVNLKDLTLHDIKSDHLDLNVFKNYKQLKSLDFSGNNLKRMDNVDVLRTLDHLERLDFSKNQLENLPEILEHLNPEKIYHINLNDNFMGELNETTFAKFAHLTGLYLSNTGLSLRNLKPFESLKGLVDLDISQNNLENVDFAASSLDLKDLRTLDVNYCHIANVSALVRLLGPSLWSLNLASNYLGDLNIDTFKPIKQLMALNVSNSNLTYADLSIIEYHPFLRLLDLSQNNLESVHFSEVHLQEEEAKLKNAFEEVLGAQNAIVDISNNQFTCDYLTTLMEQTKERKNIKISFLDDVWKQKHGQNCHPNDQENNSQNL